MRAAQLLGALSADGCLWDKQLGFLLHNQHSLKEILSDSYGEMNQK